MSYSFNQAMQPQSSHIPLVLLNTERRARFILRAYLHLLLAILAFGLTEIALIQSGVSNQLLQLLLGLPWILFFVGIIWVGWVASRVIRLTESLLQQYITLAVFTVVESILFLPLLFTAKTHLSVAIQNAALLTLIGFLGLTVIVVITRRDFSLFSTMTLWVAMASLLLIIASLIFGFAPDTWVPVGMISVAGGAILRTTSRILRYYPEDRYVAAALELFASLALLFWSVVRLCWRRN
ncbi:MAG: Bax inhibitor-1 family protein [Caldilineaceae bacterium]